jgi:hypothetical protein
MTWSASRLKASRLKAGRPVPDLLLADPAGEPVPLGTLWQPGRGTLLVFLRHLG